MPRAGLRVLRHAPRGERARPVSGVVKVVGLVCPQCGEGGLDTGVTFVSVTMALDDVMRFELQGLARHRCGVEPRKRSTVNTADTAGSAGGY